MANSIKPMRLAKAAREFNVGVHTIQDFLKKKGYDEDFKPNSKLDAEMVKKPMRKSSLRSVCLWLWKRRKMWWKHQ